MKRVLMCSHDISRTLVFRMECSSVGVSVITGLLVSFMKMRLKMI